MKTKICNKCKQELPITEFYKGNDKDGLRFKCKKCIGKDNKEYRQKRGQSKGLFGDFYNWIIKNNFPKNLQILCHNCNMSKGLFGYCPHIKEQEAEAKRRPNEPVH